MAPAALVARDAAIVGMLCAAAAAFASPGDLGFSVHPHPAWAAVLLLAVRHGTRGLAFALPAVWGALALSALATGLGGLPVPALGHPADVGALAAAVLVAWVASVHERRAIDLGERATRLERRGAEVREVVGQLRTATLDLGARADRMKASLTVIREVAASLEGDDPVAGAHAALDLALARTGARAGAVYACAENKLRTVAARGTWSVDAPTAPDFVCDGTARAALETGRPVRALDLLGAHADDSDIASPITDDTGTILGVVALRGVPADSLRPALMRDVELIARWCAGALGTAPLPDEVRALVPLFRDDAVALVPFPGAPPAMILPN